MELKDIFDFNESDLERFEKPAGSGKEVRGWDDLVIREQKALISQLEEQYPEENRCIFLERLGQFFYFCRARVESLSDGKARVPDKPEPSSYHYQAKVDHFEMQLFCLPGPERYCKCIYYRAYQDRRR